MSTGKFALSAKTFYNARMIICGLDIATKCGWAVGQPGTKAAFGAINLARESDDEGAVFEAFERFLAELLMTHCVTHLCCEETYVPRPPIRFNSAAPAFKAPPMNPAVLYRLFGLRAIARLIARKRGIVYREIPIGKLSRAFTGTARHGGRDAKKRATMEMAKLRGYDVRNSDEADAVSVWEYGCGLFAPAKMVNRSGSLPFGDQKASR